MWVIYPGTRTAYVRTSTGTFAHLSADDYLDGFDVLPGFSVRLSDVFPPAAPAA